MTRQTWVPAYIGVGSNLSNPKLQVMRGIEALAELPKTKLVARSRLYRSAPVGPREQPDYVNAVTGLLTQLSAVTLLHELKALEEKLGRERPVVRWGPRVIDFDLLVFGSERATTEELQIPHPGITERAFVLIPLLDIAPDLDVPGHGPAQRLAQRVAASDVELA